MRIIIGAGGSTQPGWVSTEREQLDLLRPDDWPAFLQGRPVEAILCEAVFEHLTAAESRIAAATCYRFLQPGGYLRVAVPDGYNPDPHYIEWVRPGGTGAGASEHRILYTYQTFVPLFMAAGFRRIRLLEWHDETGVFHQQPWLECDGLVTRSRNHDARPWYSMLLLDAFKEET